MPSEIVSRWFGERFTQLHPQLQQLHRNGGQLGGEVEIAYGRGIAGFMGRRLARKMGFPAAGRHRLKVGIAHDHNSLLWSRTFDDQPPLLSVFTPVGTVDDGYWLESTGPLSMQLTVEIIEGGWYWRCLGIRLLGLPVPRWLMPRTNACKTIEAGGYRFHVGVSLPLLGTLVHYQGLLQLQ